MKILITVPHSKCRPSEIQEQEKGLPTACDNFVMLYANLLKETLTPKHIITLEVCEHYRTQVDCNRFPNDMSIFKDTSKFWHKRVEEEIERADIVIDVHTCFPRCLGNSDPTSQEPYVLLLDNKSKEYFKNLSVTNRNASHVNFVLKTAKNKGKPAILIEFTGRDVEKDRQLIDSLKNLLNSK